MQPKVRIFSIRTAAVSLLAVLFAAAPPVRANVAPGDSIDHTNWQSAKNVLPEPVLRWIERGDLSLVIGEMQDEIAFEPAFRAASEANAGRYDVDEEGTLVESASGKRPAHAYGFPFPIIAEDDPNAAIKMMWNTSFAAFKSGSLSVPFDLVWMGRNGFERTVGGRTFVLWFDGRPEPLENPDQTEVRDILLAETPASANGNATLGWRYMDARPDSVWGYSPAARRIRQLTAANRSDPAFGSDVVQDDALLWAGKHQSFNWKLVGSREMLVPSATTSYVSLEPGRSGPMGREWRSTSSFEGARFGWQTPGWGGAPWMPTNFVWVDRRGTPEGPLLQLRAADFLHRPRDLQDLLQGRVHAVRRILEDAVQRRRSRGSPRRQPASHRRLTGRRR
jgi:hypothetical protein